MARGLRFRGSMLSNSSKNKIVRRAACSLDRVTGSGRGGLYDFLADAHILERTPGNRMSVLGPHANRDAHAPSSPGWELMPAVLGRADLLVGPSPRDRDGEALALVAPGTRISGVEEGSVSASQGWRVALWAADADGDRHIDVGRPVWLGPVTLRYVIDLIEGECRNHLTWVGNRLEDQLKNAAVVQRPDFSGHVSELARQWHLDALTALADLDHALASRAIPAEPAGLSWLDELVIAYHQDSPGTEKIAEVDPRLRRGYLQRFYDERCSRSADAAPGPTRTQTILLDDDTTAPLAWNEDLPRRR